MGGAGQAVGAICRRHWRAGKNLSAKGKNLLFFTEILFHTQSRDTDHIRLFSMGYARFCLSVADGTRLALSFSSSGDRADF